LRLSRSGDPQGMSLLKWWRRKRREHEREAEALERMRRADEPRQTTPREVYLSQTRD
jgi:hypothetical protein